MKSLASVSTVGVDLAKLSVQVHCVDSAGTVVLAKRIARGDFLSWCSELPSGCLVGMEACCAAHYWARQLEQIGLTPRLISPFFVTPYRMQGKTGKNDANDAAAICEAVSRPQMRFVGIKSPEQQSLLVLHTLREGMVRDRVACANRIRGVLAEFGMVLPKSAPKFSALAPDLIKELKSELTPLARMVLMKALQVHTDLQAKIHWCDQQIDKHSRADPLAKLAGTVCGVGPMASSAISASAGDLSQFKNARQFSAWLGLVPRIRASGEKHFLGTITRRGNGYIRKLMVIGARAALRVAVNKDDSVSRWAIQLKERVGDKKAAVALANKNARIVWSLFAQRRATMAEPHGHRVAGLLEPKSLDSGKARKRSAKDVLSLGSA